MNLPSKIWSDKVVAGPNGCHIWTRSIRNSGYGRVRKDGKTRSTHRVIYEECFGPIPEGLMILHKCNVKRCVNPLHLYAGTAADNTRDLYASGYKPSEEHRAKIRAANLGRKHTEEAREKIRAAKLGKAGKSPTEETRAKLRAASLGRTHTAEARAKISAAKLGKPGKKHTPEHRAKIAAAINGRHHTEEQRATMRAAWVLRKHRNYSCKE